MSELDIKYSLGGTLLEREKIVKYLQDHPKERSTQLKIVKVLMGSSIGPAPIVRGFGSIIEELPEELIIVYLISMPKKKRKKILAEIKESKKSLPKLEKVIKDVNKI